MMLLADSVRDAGYKVVLTGEGADEAFGGYDLFKEARIRRFVARAPQSNCRGDLLGRLYPYLAHSPAASTALAQQFFSGRASIRSTSRISLTCLALPSRGACFQFFRGDWRERLLAWDPSGGAEGATASPSSCAGSRLSAISTSKAHTLMTGYLLSSQGDRMAMAASVEARYPFLDHRVIEFACRLPPRLKLRGLREKARAEEGVGVRFAAVDRQAKQAAVSRA